MMKRDLVWLGMALVLVVFCSLTISVEAAPMGTAFSYQGRLMDGGSPANGTYDFEFKLFNSLVDGTQVGSTFWREEIPVAGGLINVEVDFGAFFNGEARYLEIGIRLGGSTGPFSLLTPRQTLTPAPYALYAASAPGLGGGDITGVLAGTGLSGGGYFGEVILNVNLAGSGTANTIARSDHSHIGQSWTGNSPTNLFRVDNDGSGSGIVAQTSSTNNGAIYAENLSTGPAIQGTGASGDGGAFSSLGAGAGVRGTGNPGVYGLSSTGNAIKGESSTSGWASIYGLHTNNGMGVYGSGAPGVQGVSTTGHGMKGQSSMAGWSAVYGEHSSNGFGVYGISNYTGNYGYLGGNYRIEGSCGPSETCYRYSYGVYAVTPLVWDLGQVAFNDEIAAVYGYASNTLANGISFGGIFESKSGHGTGVYARGKDTGVEAHGKHAIDAFSTCSEVDCTAGYFGGKVIVTGDTRVLGNLEVVGSKNFINPHPHDPSKRIVYVSLEGGENGVYVRGKGQLNKGVALIDLPEHFSLVAAEEGLTVQLTPRDGKARGYMYAESVTPLQLVVKEAGGGSGEAGFDYLVMGLRKGFEVFEPIQEKPEK
jgi:hypothetical protein